MGEKAEMKQISFEVLKKNGTRWAVLAAMKIEMLNNGISTP